MAERIWVKVPAPTDPALAGKGMLRKPGPRRWTPMETPAEAHAGMRGEPVPLRPKYRPDYFTEEPEEVEMDPRILRHLLRGNLVRVPAPERRQPMVDFPNDSTVIAVADKE